jgi:hypothetical protein
MVTTMTLDIMNKMKHDEGADDDDDANEHDTW